VKNKIRNIIEIKDIQFFINELNYKENRPIFGIFEEKLMILLFESNKLSLNNLKFTEENIFEIYEIYQFKNSAYKKTKKKFKSYCPILVTQKYYKGENYDFLILMPIKNKLKKIVYIAYFIQVGTNKSQQIIEKINKDLKENETKYKKGIKNFLGIDVDSNLLLFIFDKETQEQLIKDGKSAALKYCLRKGIFFYLFSCDSYLLYIYNNFDNIKYHVAKNFGNFRVPKRRNINDLIKNEFFSSIEKKIINEFANIDISKWILDKYTGEYEGFPKLSYLDKKKIYICEEKEEDERFYIINNKIYFIKEDSFELLNDNQKYKNHIFHLSEFIFKD
jgi:hypothetical protein